MNTTTTPCRVTLSAPPHRPPPHNRDVVPVQAPGPRLQEKLPKITCNLLQYPDMTHGTVIFVRIRPGVVDLGSM